MKRILLLGLFLGIGVQLFAQGIDFKPVPFSEALRMAKTQHKMLFVDCYTSWCGPCKMLSPVIDEIAKEYEGKAKICRVNVDEEMELAQQYRVMSVPTVLVFKNGQVSGTSIGYVGKEKLTEML